MKKILILTANPKDTDRLRLDEEVREITKALERSRHREQFEIVLQWATRPDDLRRSLLDHEPYIVHFSGHGEGEKGIALESKIGKTQLVSATALTNLFGAFKNKIQGVVLNACYSEVQANAIHQQIDTVIGMKRAIGDRASIEFAVGFYDALFAGRSLSAAFDLGCISIDLEGIPESDTPVLKRRGDEGGSVWVQNENLELPAGQVELTSPFYVERPPIEGDCFGAIAQAGALIRVKAARQMGKTSLMSRILSHAEKQGCRSVPVYFQEADGEVFGTLDGFLRWFCATLTDDLGLPDRSAEFWERGALSHKRRCTNYLQQYLLTAIESPLVLGLDEVDLVFQHLPIAQDFFALLRTWHERGKNDPIWQKLRLVIVHSKEVYIPLDMHQSPFNVGLPIELPELSQIQVQNLAERHGLRFAATEVEALMAMVSGHPYLVRVALYDIARGRKTLAQLLQVAPTQAGPYDDHLRRHLVNLRENPKLVNAMRLVIAADHPVQIGADEAFQLRSMGLVKFQGDAVLPLCNLYRLYFRDRLGEIRL